MATEVAAPQARTRPLTIVAQDPAVTDARGRILTTEVEVPAEELAPGPCGYRVHVIDFDTSTRTLYKPFDYKNNGPGARRTGFVDPFRKGRKPGEPLPRKVVLDDPRFHAQNVYAIAMRTLARFEFALGRRVSWGFYGHQLKIAPHAFADANAFYSDRDQSLLFGYFPGRSGTVFSCLSHDVVAHETTHALIDGLRERFTDPSSPDQAAFHEGFSDVAALLSVFSLRALVRGVLDRSFATGTENGAGRASDDLVHQDKLTAPQLKASLLFGLAKQMGQEMLNLRGQALRQSATLTASPDHLDAAEFQEPHRRGEILVAAVMNAFINVWINRLKGLGRIRGKYLDRQRVAEEASDAADYLLTMCIRALDYTPPVHIEFGDFLSALLTADHEIRPDDSRFGFRDRLRESFASYGITPAASKGGAEPGIWCAPENRHLIRCDRTHFEPMTRDVDEVFRFVWENRAALRLFQGAFTRVLTVRGCLRIAPDDGFPLRETVAECLQQLDVTAGELKSLGLRKPDEMPDDTPIALQGGMTLIFDEYGQLKFTISNRLLDPDRKITQERQSLRLQHLWDYGHFRKGASFTRRFSSLHRRRVVGMSGIVEEGW